MQVKLRQPEATRSANNMFVLRLRQDVNHRGLRDSIAGLRTADCSCHSSHAVSVHVALGARLPTATPGRGSNRPPGDREQ